MEELNEILAKMNLHLDSVGKDEDIKNYQSYLGKWLMNEKKFNPQKPKFKSDTTIRRELKQKQAQNGQTKSEKIGELAKQVNEYYTGLSKGQYKKSQHKMMVTGCRNMLSQIEKLIAGDFAFQKYTDGIAQYRALLLENENVFPARKEDSKESVVKAPSTASKDVVGKLKEKEKTDAQIAQERLTTRIKGIITMIEEGQIEKIGEVNQMKQMIKNDLRQMNQYRVIMTEPEKAWYNVTSNEYC